MSFESVISIAIVVIFFMIRVVGVITPTPTHDPGVQFPKAQFLWVFYCFDLLKAYTDRYLAGFEPQTF